MTDDSLHIMRDEHLLRQLAREHDYDRSLVGTQERDSISLDDLGEFGANDSFASSIQDFFDGIVGFIASVPTVVWVVVGIVVAALLCVWVYRSRLFGNRQASDMDFSTADDVYAVDFDSEMADAELRADHAALVRLLYLRTLRQLDEGHHIEWKISKTPSQYDREVGLPAFASMTRTFLLVRYGKYPADSDMVAQVRTWADDTLREKGGEA